MAPRISRRSMAFAAATGVAITPVVRASTPVPEVSAPGECGLRDVVLSRERVAALYSDAAATGAEAEPLVELLRRYGEAITAGNYEQMLTVITPDFDEAARFGDCAEHWETSQAPFDFIFTPLRVTSNGEGEWLAFVQRLNPEDNYSDVFMLIAVDTLDGQRIDYAHRDLRFDDGSATTAEDIYLNGL